MADTYRSYRRDDCRICGSQNLIDYLDLRPQPPSNSFITREEIAHEQRFPLIVALCSDCGQSQLRDIVSAADIFEDYLYLSSTSAALRQHYQGLVTDALARIAPFDGDLMVDIGCNDGVLLKAYPKERYRLVGVEPSSAGKYAREAGFEVEASFFDEKTAIDMVRQHGPAQIITATNVFAHVDDIRGFTMGVRQLLNRDGAFIIEFPYLLDTVDRILFDTVYHEHLSYLSLTPLARLFKETGLKTVHVERQEIGASGPAIRLFVCRDDSRRQVDESVSAMLRTEENWGVADIRRYQEFAGRVSALAESLRGTLQDIKSAGASIAGYSAPAKGNTLLNYVGLGPEDIACIAENNSLKVGRLTPGSHIPIVSEPEFLAEKYSHALLLAWNYLDSFLANSPYIAQGGRFIVPLPEPIVRP